MMIRDIPPKAFIVFQFPQFSPFSEQTIVYMNHEALEQQEQAEREQREELEQFLQAGLVLRCFKKGILLMVEPG